jgi:alkyl sulfatase BDS1-like metallo-beta-lactamase superfamily hydrolase
MGRRATYMYGNLLEPSPTGFVTTGLGAAEPVNDFETPMGSI